MKKKEEEEKDDSQNKKDEQENAKYAAAAKNKKTVSANAFVSGSNMNGGCVMTDRPTSRVLAPPGGETSFRLG